jgi:diadenosine tetraphosphate (Ap4A) HIT family hydrolase
MRKTGILLPALALLGGIGVGGYLFSESQPRSFLALSDCVSCYQPNDLAGLLASVWIQKASGAIPLVAKETDRCVAIEHPFHREKFHFVVFPKKDIKDIAHISVDDQPYVQDCLAIVRALVVENDLRTYRVETNGPGLQNVTYLHFHLVSSDGRSPRGQDLK